MGVHPWPIFDPASAYMTMTGGAWAGPMHAAGTALQALGVHVETTAGLSEVNDTIVGESWSGQGRTSAAASVSVLNTDQTLYASLSTMKAQLLNAAGELHTTTVPQMVTHIQANANRGEWGIDNAINPWVLGALTPRIIDLDTEYFGFMWPNNASAGLRYGAGLDALGAALAGLSALPSLAGGAVTAPASAAADVASNAGMSMMSAVMSATEQAATSKNSSTNSAATQENSRASQTPSSAPNTSTISSGISALGLVQSQAPVSPSLPQSQLSGIGMFAAPAAAALTPSAPTPAVPASPPVQAMTPSAPGVTSFAKPNEPFNPPPPPSGGKATGLKPGMLNASALRGPVGTAPGSTALLTKPLTTASSLATEPLAYATPQVPQPVSSPPPPHPPLQDSGSIQTLNPPPQLQQQPAPPSSPPQPPQPQPQQQSPADRTSQPSYQPSSGSGTGAGGFGGSGMGGGSSSGGNGISQMPNLSQAASAQWAMTAQPQSAAVGSRFSQQTPTITPDPPECPDPTEMLKDWSDLVADIDKHNENPPDPTDLAAVAEYDAEAIRLNSKLLDLSRKLLDCGIPTTINETPKQSR